MRRRAITLHQPYATLMALGVKGPETRSWPAPPAAIGERLLIHAAVRRPPGGGDPGRSQPVGDWLPYRTERGAWRLEHYAHGHPAVPLGGDLPLTFGAIVASGTLQACIPMVERCSTNMEAPPHLCASGGELLYHRPESDPFPDGSTEQILTDQRPYGDYEAGRWAWLLAGVLPTTERCPACWGTMDDEVDPDPWCPFCHGAGGCEPIPAKGYQRVWWWTP